MTQLHNCTSLDRLITPYRYHTQTLFTSTIQQGKLTQSECFHCARNIILPTFKRNYRYISSSYT